MEDVHSFEKKWGNIVAKYGKSAPPNVSKPLCRRHSEGKIMSPILSKELNVKDIMATSELKFIKCFVLSTTDSDADSYDENCVPRHLSSGSDEVFISACSSVGDDERNFSRIGTNLRNCCTNVGGPVPSEVAIINISSPSSLDTVVAEGDTPLNNVGTGHIKGGIVDIGKTDVSENRLTGCCNNRGDKLIQLRAPYCTSKECDTSRHIPDKSCLSVSNDSCGMGRITNLVVPTPRDTVSPRRSHCVPSTQCVRPPRRSRRTALWTACNASLSGQPQDGKMRPFSSDSESVESRESRDKSECGIVHRELERSTVTPTTIPGNLHEDYNHCVHKTSATPTTIPGNSHPRYDHCTRNTSASDYSNTKTDEDCSEFVYYEPSSIIYHAPRSSVSPKLFAITTPDVIPASNATNKFIKRYDSPDILADGGRSMLSQQNDCFVCNDAPTKFKYRIAGSPTLVSSNSSSSLPEKDVATLFPNVNLEMSGCVDVIAPLRRHSAKVSEEIGMVTVQRYVCQKETYSHDNWLHIFCASIAEDLIKEALAVIATLRKGEFRDDHIHDNLFGQSVLHEHCKLVSNRQSDRDDLNDDMNLSAQQWYDEGGAGATSTSHTHQPCQINNMMNSDQHTQLLALAMHSLLNEIPTSSSTERTLPNIDAEGELPNVIEHSQCNNKNENCQQLMVSGRIMRGITSSAFRPFHNNSNTISSKHENMGIQSEYNELLAKEYLEQVSDEEVSEYEDIEEEMVMFHRQLTESSDDGMGGEGHTHRQLSQSLDDEDRDIMHISSSEEWDEEQENMYRQTGFYGDVDDEEHLRKLREDTKALEAMYEQYRQLVALAASQLDKCDSSQLPDGMAPEQLLKEVADLQLPLPSTEHVAPSTATLTELHQSSGRDECSKKLSEERGDAKVSSILWLPVAFLLFSAYLYWLSTCLPEHNRHHHNLPDVSFPSSVEELHSLAYLLSLYTEHHYTYVVILFSSAYIFKQTFAIPGSVLMNILGGALFGLWPGFALVCVLSAVGATSCYLLARLCGRRHILRYFPHYLRTINEKVEEYSDSLLFLLLFLRLFPMTPSWFLNMASPICGVPVHLFFFSVLIGLMPYNFVCIQAGCFLSQLTSINNLFTWWTLFKLLIIANVALVPGVIIKYFHDKRELRKLYTNHAEKDN